MPAENRDGEVFSKADGKKRAREEDEDVTFTESETSLAEDQLKKGNKKPKK